jgi:hypothetical protein
MRKNNSQSQRSQSNDISAVQQRYCKPKTMHISSPLPLLQKQRTPTLTDTMSVHDSLLSTRLSLSSSPIGVLVATMVGGKTTKTIAMINFPSFQYGVVYLFSSMFFIPFFSLLQLSPIIVCCCLAIIYFDTTRDRLD